MKSTNSFSIPKIILDSKDEILIFLEKNKPKSLFENIEEKDTPQGIQWNYKLTALIDNKKIGVAILEFQEYLYEKPDFKKRPTAEWLNKLNIDKNLIFKGEIIP